MLCSVSYFESSGGLEFAHHRPYPIKYYFEACTWESAKGHADRLHVEFMLELREDEKEV